MLDQTDTANFLQLLEKYNRPGPRYTSYPTALHFTEEIDTRALATETAAETGNLSIYFHLPFCESLCWFCGCTKVITTDQTRADVYLDRLERELDAFIGRIQPGRQVVQLHFGGGTPNFLDAGQLERLGKIIHQHFTFHPDAECSVELDPRRLNREQVFALRALGMNRASFGVQDVKREVQEAIHRVQPREQNEAAIAWLREAGFNSFNIDLIYGLPGQTEGSFRETLREVMGYGPDRLVTFSYAHVPWVNAAQKILEKKALPSTDEKFRMLIATNEELTAGGYAYIGLDHFAKESDELTQAQRGGTLQRNFQGYSTWAGTEICGFGMSSISQTARSYRQNVKDLDAYYAAIDAGKLPVARGVFLTDDDQIRRTTIMRLMCDMGLDFGSMSETLGVDFLDYFSPALHQLREMESDGLLSISDTGLTVHEAGRLFIRNIAMAFDAYLSRGPDRYSKTV